MRSPLSMLFDDWYLNTNTEHLNSQIIAKPGINESFSFDLCNNQTLYILSMEMDSTDLNSCWIIFCSVSPSSTVPKHTNAL